ncbi:hypothetical protein GCM10023196_065620 [Actinoallomurus vinaceus]|uniref:SseB protein N-terminal domain-containing protein n=1 Tax=Actinoallomurus vinaceus TaxID=1080074 RepID=A0ABP8UK69_9ACTN
MTGTWEPANQLEQQLSDALGDGDQNAYFKLLSTAELVLPLPQVEPGSPGQPAFTWPTSTHEGRTHVLAYTSVEAARACLGPGYEHFVPMPLAEMANTWPDTDWWLAVNSGLPIEGYLPAWFVGQLTANLPPAQEAPSSPAAQSPTGQESAYGTHAGPTGQDAVHGSSAPAGHEMTYGAQSEQEAVHGSSAPAGQETAHGAQTGQETPYGAQADQEGRYGAPAEQEMAHGSQTGQERRYGAPAEQETTYGAEQESAHGQVAPAGQYTGEAAPAHGSLSFPPLSETSLPPVPPAEPSALEPGAVPPPPGDAPAPSPDAHSPAGGPTPAPFGDAPPSIPGGPAPASFGDGHPPVPSGPTSVPLGDGHPQATGGPTPAPLGDGHSPAPGEPTPATFGDGRPPFPGEPAPASVTETAPFPRLAFPTPPPEGPPPAPGPYPPTPAWEESFGETTIADAPTAEAFAGETSAGEQPAGDRLTGDRPTGESSGGAPTGEPVWGAPDGRTPAGQAPPYPSFSTAGAVPPAPAEGAPPAAATAPQPIVSGDEPMPPGPGQADPRPSPVDAPTQGEPRPVPSDMPLTPHFTADADFVPLDEEERLLYDAAARDDREGILRTLLGARQIWVPMVEGGDLMLGPGRPGFQWYTRESGGRTVVPLFTGPSRMREAMGGHPFILSDLAKVLRFWPDPAWDLVINDGSPIGATIPGDRVTPLSRRVDDEAAERLASDFPAQNDAERRLFEARNDPDAHLQVLLEASVFLPVWSRTPPTVQTPPSDPAFPWAAVSVRGRASVLAFTSFDWMKEAVGTTGFVMPTFADLLAAWQEPSWDVAVNPGTPIEIALSGEQIHAVATSLANRAATPGAPPSAPVAPPGDLTQDASTELHQAPTGPPPEPVAAALATPAAPPETPPTEPEPAPGLVGIPGPAEAAPSTAEPGPAQIPTSIAVPTATAPSTAAPQPVQIPTSIPVPAATTPPTAAPQPIQIPTSVPVPTATAPSTAELQPELVPTSIAVPTATAPPTVEPEPAQMPAGVQVPAETALPTVAQAEPQAVVQAESRTPADGAFTIMQKVLVHDQVPWYLDKAYDRVAGFVHRVQDVIDLNTPQRLYECLGLIRDGSPFTVDDPEVYVIRWAAYRAGLYRTPFGGTNEDALKEWGKDGWVVEPPPFTGDGFASGSAGSIPEYKAESFRLPHSSEMYVISSDGSERFVARYDADRLVWEKDN